MPRSLTVSVLGPLEVRVEGRPVSIGGAKPRAVLSLLALYGDSVVPGATLIEVLWGDDPPRTAGKALQTHVSALRRALGEGFVLTKGAGWMLAEADTDAARFTAAADAGRKAARAGNPSGAVAAFTEAIDSWRGAPELPDTPRAASEVTRWVELRETVADDRIAAALAGGSDAELVSELESAVAHAPLRERRWGQLMLALYRAGRQADALAAYRRARALLDEQLGVEPGPDLRALERAILGHDPALAAPKAVATAARPRMPVRSALPVQRTTFVGRQDELRRVDELLRGHSLVTVTGPGGVGKTRLAVAAAQAAARLFRGGVAFVDLVPVSPEFVVPAVASALGVTEQPPQDLAGTVRERLARGRWLVVLDNCEHVLEAVGALAEELTAGCPELAILATSRERLGVPGERVIAVPGLELPVPGTGDPRGSAAVTLFVDRARAVDRGFDPDRTAVAEVCARLDGIPLAIELAAARCASLGIDGVRAGLNDRMQLLTGARGTERHRSLRAVLDWSHDLLDDAERVAFRRLSVFADGFDLSAAIAVASETTDGDDAVLMADLVGRLADKNLLTRVRARVGSRWRMLEIIRVYGRELLAASGEEPRVRSRHLRWAADSAERIEARLTAAEPWREEFDAVADDLRAALSTVASGAGHSAPAAVLAWALGHLSYAADYLAGARAHYRLAAAASGSTAVAALRAAAGVAFAQMRSDLAFDLLLEAGDRAAEAGDRPAEAASLASAVVLGARCPGSFPQAPSGERLNRLLSRARAAADGSAQVEAHIAAAAAWTASPVRARCDGPLGEIALAAARRLDDPVLISAALDGVTTVALGEGRFRDAARLARGRLNLLERFTRHDPHAGGEIKDIFHMVTETAIAAGDLPCALATATRARQDTIAAGQAVPMLASSRLVLTHALCGAFVEAVEEAAEMHAAWDRAGRPPASWMAPAAYATALACGLTGDPDGRRLWTARARDLTEDRMVQGFAPFVDCRIALYTGDIDTAVGIAETLPPEYMGKFDAYARTIAAECAVVAGQRDAALRLDAVVPAARENDWAAACTARARGRLTGEWGLLDDAVAGWERITARFEWACTLLLVDDQAPEGAAVLTALGCPIPAGVT